VIVGEGPDLLPRVPGRYRLERPQMPGSSSCRSASVTGLVLVLAPSRGRGGGIERYVAAVQWALAVQGVEHYRIDLAGSGVVAQARLLAQARALLRAGPAVSRIVVAHRALLPAASVLASEGRGCGISLICHGNEIWGPQLGVRRQIERYLMGRPSVRVVAVSSFTAGAVRCGRPAAVLHPGIPQPWFDTLVGASDAAGPRRPGINLVTAFRLEDWRTKGLPQLLGAVAKLGRGDVQVTVCGSGKPSAELRQFIEGHQRCTLLTDLADQELAGQLAAADLFILATRTKRGSRPSGEGFGFVLLEAQITGTPVIGPAFGGSHDAFIDRVTGFAPEDETTESLARILEEALGDPSRLARMGVRAAEWARESFAPESYPARVVARLL
jgi:phosphatidyl-myo-inositol dimannoside synthase